MGYKRLSNYLLTDANQMHKKLVILLSFILLLSGCEKFVAFNFHFPKDYDYFYCFIPDKYAQWTKDTSINFSYDDLSLVKLHPWNKQENIGQVNYGQGTIDYSFYCWGSDTVSFFIFDKETVEKHRWEDIVRDYMVLQRYDFSKEDLLQLKCQIPYPPTAEMSTMHMYPPYRDVVRAK